MNPSADDATIALPALPGSVASIDICFDGVRVWSIDLSASALPEDRTLPWPEPLIPHLVGSTEITVVDSGDGVEYARFPAVFDAAPTRTTVVDGAGIPLAINKWGRLGKTLGAGNPGVQERILQRTSEIIEVLRGFGLRPFIVGGTLLGAVRDGALLPHDDDADVAYLSEHTHPADVAREGFSVGHRLQAVGYELVRHSATHMQLYFRDSAGALDHYVDVFTAFYSADGLINQPFHVRGDLARDDMLPFSTVEIDGKEFPAPARPEAWLEINYDKNWRTPIPGYHLDTPVGTKRRFDAWFGAFHFQRDFWNDWYTERGAEGDAEWDPGRNWVAAQNSSLTAPTLIDLGAGSGAFSAELAALSPGRRVIAADFAHAATALTRTRVERTAVESAHVNLYRTLSLAAPQSLGVAGPFDVVAVHLLDQSGHLARGNALRLIRMALRSGGAGFATLFGMPAENVSFDDPTTWHLARHDLVREAKDLGLAVDFEPISNEDVAASDQAQSTRAPYGARFTLSDQPFPPKEESLRQRLKRLFLRARPQSAREAIETLTERVSELEHELDEYRRDSLRIAELMDLAEQRLTPPASSPRSDTGTK
ncbi:LicD family protein [Leucobacter sp. NPDC015123]|uniref:LicD family protein n=1 Tax=Leucobacter sp. NPDC015123 TaxID=3364129 RepID=UPI0036F48E71